MKKYLILIALSAVFLTFFVVAIPPANAQCYNKCFVDAIDADTSNDTLETCYAATAATPEEDYCEDQPTSCRGVSGTKIQCCYDICQGTPAPMPTPPVLSCTPSLQSTQVGEPVSLHADGGVGPYYWNASPDGNPFVGTLQDFVVWYSAPGTKTVYLDDNSGHSTSCVVEVTSPTPTPPPVNSPPIASDVNISTNYCATGPTVAVVNWSYSDPNNVPVGTDPQSAYQVQVAQAGSGFNALVFDSGKLSGGNTAHTVSTLPLNRSLQARVRVWDSQDVISAWSAGSAVWQSPKHPYPQVNFCWPENCNAPAAGPKPAANSSIQFTDRTTFYDNGSNRNWLWNFGDGGTSTQQNPRHTYSTLNSYNILLTATDSDGYACSLVRPIGVRRAIPLWKEVSPGL